MGIPFLSTARFLGRNLWHARSIPSVPIRTVTTKSGDIVILRGARKSDITAIDRMFAQLHDGASLGRNRQLLYRLSGHSLVVVAEEEDANSVIGIGLYYFNARDVRERTVHQGFRGVEPARQGCGIGSVITRHAIKHFARTRLSGISSRVSLDNTGSLKSNEKLGFKPVERYFDPQLNEERYYLVCDLSKWRQD